MDSSTLQHSPHDQSEQSEMTLGKVQIETLMRDSRDKFKSILEAQKKVQQAYLSQQKELELSRQKVQQLEEEKGEYLLENLRPVTSFDVTDEYLSKEINILYRSLMGWAYSLPEIDNSPSIFVSDSTSAYQFLRRRDGSNPGLALSHQSQKVLEAELVAAGLSRIFMDRMFSQQLFGIPTNERRVFHKLQNGAVQMNPGEGTADPDEIGKANSVV